MSVRIFSLLAVVSAVWLPAARTCSAPWGVSKIYSIMDPEQCITRQQAIRLYTINCAYLTFEETEKGSLEKGKLADFIVLSKDILSCPLDQIKDIEVQRTCLGGKRVH